MDSVEVIGWIVVADGVPEMQTDGIRWRFTAADGEFKGKIAALELTLFVAGILMVFSST